MHGASGAEVAAEVRQLTRAVRGLVKMLALASEATAGEPDDSLEGQAEFRRQLWQIVTESTEERPR
jgi:hypothetical protein